MRAEVVGRTEFPPIGELPYFFTLGPHSFYWFRLEPPAESIARGTSCTDGVCQAPLLSIEENWTGTLEGAFRHVLENEVLPVWMPRQRWFRAKTRTITGVGLTDWAKMGGGLFLVVLQVRCA